MAERLLWAQPVSVANHIKASSTLQIERSVTWLATESGGARSKRSAICSGKLCGGFNIFGQSCPCGFHLPADHVVIGRMQKAITSKYRYHHNGTVWLTGVSSDHCIATETNETMTLSLAADSPACSVERTRSDSGYTECFNKKHPLLYSSIPPRNKNFSKRSSVNSNSAVWKLLNWRINILWY